MAFVFGRGFVLTGNFSILTLEFFIPVDKYHPGFLTTRSMFLCPVLLYVSNLSAAMLFGYKVRVVPGHCRLLLLLLVRCWLYSSIFLFFSHTSTFQLLDKPWSQVSFLLPPRFLPSICVAHRCQHSHCSNVANLRSCAFRESI